MLSENLPDLIDAREAVIDDIDAVPHLDEFLFGDEVVQLPDCTYVDLEHVVDLITPQLIHPPLVPWSEVLFHGQYEVLDELLQGRCEALFSTIVDILGLGKSHKNFEELKSAQGIVLIVILFLFFEVGGFEQSVDDSLYQIII